MRAVNCVRIKSKLFASVNLRMVFIFASPLFFAGVPFPTPPPPPPPSSSSSLFFLFLLNNFYGTFCVHRYHFNGVRMCGECVSLCDADVGRWTSGVVAGRTQPKLTRRGGYKKKRRYRHWWDKWKTFKHNRGTCCSGYRWRQPRRPFHQQLYYVFSIRNRFSKLAAGEHEAVKNVVMLWYIAPASQPAA